MICLQIVLGESPKINAKQKRDVNFFLSVFKTASLNIRIKVQSSTNARVIIESVVTHKNQF